MDLSKQQIIISGRRVVNWKLCPVEPASCKSKIRILILDDVMTNGKCLLLPSICYVRSLEIKAAEVQRSRWEIGISIRGLLS